ncbi:hypothetical protein RHMOL_Rhmol02G0306900 [Rhododendron molle]|uniref:Uncharacterized protein n=1 Tax=Rhododendron molle TaxID=49168 RepID=A0ACC0PXP8_RHOML|nr:hypothetical protein RHMOL_Rhmol02G0306900 [Rhododendron molle]
MPPNSQELSPIVSTTWMTIGNHTNVSSEEVAKTWASTTWKTGPKCLIQWQRVFKSYFSTYLGHGFFLLIIPSYLYSVVFIYQLLVWFTF